MRIFKYTGQFRKDLKRYKHNTKMLDDLGVPAQNLMFDNFGG